MRSAVEVQYFAGDEGRAGKVEDRFGDLRHLARPLDGMKGLEKVMHFGLAHRCVDDAGRDSVNANASRCMLNCQSLVTALIPPFVRIGTAAGTSAIG